MLYESEEANEFNSDRHPIEQDIGLWKCFIHRVARIAALIHVCRLGKNDFSHRKFILDDLEGNHKRSAQIYTERRRRRRRRHEESLVE